MAIDVSQYTTPIKTAVMARDVRDNMANGMDALANEVNQYEATLSADNDQFKEDITKQQNDYETNINNQWVTYKQNMEADEAIRQNNEVTRKVDEDTRQTVYNEFRNFVNTSTHVNRVPYLFDGGYFGDSGDSGTWNLNMDGGSF